MRRGTKLLLLAAMLLTLVAGLTACGSSSKSSSSNASTDTITIKNFNFGAPITVKVGATVTVHNTDTTAHTVTADDNSFNTGPIQPGHTATIKVTKVGTVKFHCNIHNYMTGSIQVTS